MPKQAKGISCFGQASGSSPSGAIERHARGYFVHLIVVGPTREAFPGVTPPKEAYRD